MKISGYENFEVTYCTRDKFELDVADKNNLTKSQIT